MSFVRVTLGPMDIWITRIYSKVLMLSASCEVISILFTRKCQINAENTKMKYISAVKVHITYLSDEVN